MATAARILAFPNARILPVRPAPRLEPLAVADALGPDSRLRAWRGRSGRRYVVFTVPAARLPDLAEAVFVAVRRRPGISPAVLAAVAGTGADAAADARFAGADEIDVHLIARTPAERHEVAADLAAGSA
ncbi:hypothetical protein [Alsobacter sp. R-9]